LFGFMKGKIEIFIPRTTYSYGETVEGKVTLELKQPQKASGVTIQLLAIEKHHETRGGKSHLHTKNIFDQTIKLDSEREYPAGKMLEYPFKFTLPTWQGPEINMDGALGTVIKTMDAVGPILKAFSRSSSSGGTTWTLKAKMDVSGFDINKDVELQIRPWKNSTI
jgi:hypothetical protein